jgi:spermidine/putrescine transport system substrate-binding protein
MGSKTSQQQVRRILRAAKQHTRRGFLTRAALLGTAASIGPWFVRDALSSSGELNWFTWDDYEPKPFVEQFTKDTGIKLNMQIFTGNEEALNKMRSSRGVGVDLVTPGRPGRAEYCHNS